MKFLLLILIVSLSSHNLLAQGSKDPFIQKSKIGNKVWLVDSLGKKTSKKYRKLWHLACSHINDSSNVEHHFFEFSSKKGNHSKWGVGLLREDGKVIVPDTLGGSFRMINKNRVAFLSDSLHIVFDLNGHIDSAYSAHFYYCANNVIIKKKDGLYAAFSSHNEPFTDFIYSDYDTGDFMDRSPPALVYMVTPKGEVHTIGLNGKVIDP